MDVEGVVATPGDYVFVVHFFNPDNLPITNDVLVQSERFGKILTNIIFLLNLKNNFILNKLSEFFLKFPWIYLFLIIVYYVFV